jgi:hypothetical protein
MYALSWIIEDNSYMYALGVRHRYVAASRDMPATPSTPTPDDAVAALAAVLRADPPAALAEVDPATVARLAEAVSAESRRQEAEIARSIDDALRLVPRPVRGIVRRIIVPG